MSAPLPDGTILRAIKDNPNGIIGVREGDLIRLLPDGRAETLSDGNSGWWINDRHPDRLASVGLVPNTPHQPSSSIDAEQRATAAEQALADYKAKVRAAVLRNTFFAPDTWMAETNKILTALDLDPIYPPLPDAAKRQHAVVILNDGNIAIRHEDDDRPWFIYTPEGENSPAHEFEWKDDTYIAQQGVKRVLTFWSP